MKISEQWLREWVSPELSTAQLAHQMTMAGLEVDAVEAVAGDFSGVVVGEICTVDVHPDADKLRVCQVNNGSAMVQVVCGAPNATVGLKAPLAQVGAQLPEALTIAQSEIRGAASQGMLCGASELGLSEADDGLMALPADAPVGKDLRDYLALDDQVIDISITPNRADCLSLAGIAREVGLLNALVVDVPSSTAAPAQLEDVFPVVIDAAKACPRYACRVVKGVDASRPTPLWMQEKLRRSGIRSIDAVVDTTNYVMLELGQPMHAFDLDQLSGGIQVRQAASGETLDLLNGQDCQLRPETLVIADHDGPVAIAGVMGGQRSAVQATSQNILLEAAFFAPSLLAGTARSYGLHTESSHRFERGVDFALQRRALERATQLLLDIVGGAAGPIVEQTVNTALPSLHDVCLRAERIEKVLGFAMAAPEVERILLALGLRVMPTEGGWQCAIPSWRFDIDREVDLLEELARVYGYNQLPVTHIHADLTMSKKPETDLSIRHLRRHLTARGYREAITYSFIDPALQQMFSPGGDAVALSNPISEDMGVMRTSLLPGLVSAVLRNTHRQQPRVRLFETGLRFVPDAAGLQQIPTLALVCTGQRFSESWAMTKAESDFYDIKGDIESLLALTRRSSEYQFDRATHPALHNGQTASIMLGAKSVGVVGALHPALGSKLGIDAPLLVCELDLDQVLRGALPAFAPLSKYPEVRRDLSVTVAQHVAASALMRDVRAAAGTYLTDLRLFDVYTGKGIDPERKSLSLGLTFRDQSRTLGDEDVNLAVGQVIDLLEKNYNAELRN